MALFNKLFSPRRKAHAKQQENASNRLFPFTQDQVRVVLFRECDFRGRKLLFDSHAVQKVPINSTDASPATENSANGLQDKNEKFAEITNKFGYLYTKPNADVGQLGEMIFGSVAMSYRGTSFKIHSLKSPSRIMCTQVFPSPRHTKRGRSSAPSSNYFNNTVTSTHSLEHSIPLYDSGASSTTSISDHLSSQSHTSDTLLVCKGPQSTPLDVPLFNSSNGCTSSPSVIGDSGFCGEQSYSSVSSGPASCNMWDLSLPSPSGTVSFSSNSLYRRWLRSANNSLEYSGSSSTGPASADEFLLKHNQRTSKLGLAVIINLSLGEEENMMQFLMEHIALIESLVWRARQGTEGAYIRSHNFVSLMFDISACISRWLIDLLSGPQLPANFWLAFSKNCDKVNSISVFNDGKLIGNDCVRLTDLRTSSLTNLALNDRTSLNSSGSSSSFDVNFKHDKMNSSCDLVLGSLSNKSEFTFSNITKLLKSEWEAVSGKKVCCVDKNITAEKFVTEFCELLETVDMKHTNFFISTLLTAVLTHHLGWVNTSLPSSFNKQIVSQINSNLLTNPLWGQMNDLFGAVGYPTKISHTIITGTNKSDLITRLLNVLTYFIRCSDIKRNNLSRADIGKENEIVSGICQENACIPKENYKKYEDHLKEMALVSKTKRNKLALKKEIDEKCATQDVTHEGKSLKRLSKTQTLGKDLGKLGDENGVNSRLDEMEDLRVKGEEKCQLKPTAGPFHELLDKIKDLNIQAIEKLELSNEEIAEKVNKLYRFPANSVLCHLQGNNSLNLVDISVASEEIKKAFSPKKIKMEKQAKGDFSFDEGDIEKLSENACDGDNKKSSVIFVLGDNDRLVGLKKDCVEELKDFKNYCNYNTSNGGGNGINKRNGMVRPKSLNFAEENCKRGFHSAASKDVTDGDLQNYPSESTMKASTSWNSLNAAIGCSKMSEIGACSNDKTSTKSPEKTQTASTAENETKEAQSKYRYSGVKFNFQQYPNIFTNYLKSQNLTLSEKAMELNNIPGMNDDPFDFTNCKGDGEEEVEALQTPSNASELEFTSELVVKDQSSSRRDKSMNEAVVEVKEMDNCAEPFMAAGNVKKGEKLNQETELKSRKMKIVTLPMPRSILCNSSSLPVGYTHSLMKGMTDHYVSDMVLQGISTPKSEWEAALKSDLILAARHPVLDQPVEEAVTIIANLDTWEVQLMSSHTYVVDRGSSGVRVGMSQLVANMLDSLLQMWRLRASPECCLMHIEQRLQEFCTRSKALAQLLLATEFCSMDYLTSTLQLEVNDVPLLMAIASTHSPQVTQKYGLSFQ